MSVRPSTSLLVAAAVLLWGGASLAQPIGGTLSLAVQAEPNGLCLITTPLAVSYQLMTYNVYETLLRYTADGDLIPLLAESYEVEEVEGGATYTFHLRSGVLFHDGTPFDAGDVKYTFDQLLSPAVASPNASSFDFLREVVVVDERTVRFVTKGKGAPLVGYLASAKGVGILPEGANLEALRTHPVGTGPFVFEEWVPGDHLTFVRNPTYWQAGLPRLERVVVRFISDAAASLAALQAGDLDLVDRMLAESALQLEGDPRFKVVSGPMNLAQLLAMNNARPPFDKLLVRQAISYAIDRTAIIAATDLKAEWGTPIGSHACPLNPYYVDLTGRYPHDPARARALLAQAGYPNGFKATIVLPQQYEIHVRAGEVIADELRQVGIECTLELVDFSSGWLARVYNQRDYDMTVIGHDQGIEPAANFKGFERIKADGTSDYYWQYTSPFLRDLLARGKDTFDLTERKAIYAMVQTHIADEAVCAWIQDPHLLEGMRAGVMGFVALPIYVIDLGAIWLEG